MQHEAQRSDASNLTHPRRGRNVHTLNARRMQLPELYGITFDNDALGIAERLIEQLRSTGDCDVYPLPRMHKGRGEIRIAHHGPVGKKKARGVFGRLIPIEGGVSFSHRRKNLDDGGRTRLTDGNFDAIVRAANARREITKDPVKGSVRVPRHKAGTLSGGRPESNPRKF